MSNALFVRLVVGSIKKYVNSNIEECRLTLLTPETGKVDKIGAPLPPNRFFFGTQQEKQKYALKRNGLKNPDCKQEKHPLRGFQLLKISTPTKSGISKARSSRCRDGSSRGRREAQNSSSSELSRFPERLPCRRHAKVRDPFPAVIQSVNELYERALDYRTYRLVDKPSEYDGNVAKNIAKDAKRLQTQKPCATFDAFYLVFVISFLTAMKLVCDTNSIRDRAAMLIYLFSMKGPSANALNARLRFKPAS